MEETRSKKAGGDGKPGMYRIHNQCRACGSSPLTKVFDLGVQPLANDFCKPDQMQAGYAPLSVVLCQSCSLAQLSVVVDPKLLYSHYNYVTSHSATMNAHFEQILCHMKEENGTGHLIEIGSNDGYFMMAAQDSGFKHCIGVDPAKNLHVEAMSKGFSTIPSMFDRWAAARINEWLDHFGRQPTTIVARHVFCHIDNWKEFIENLERISDKDTLVCIEVPYVVDTLANVEFDQIYHEHLSFMSVRAMQWLLQGTKFHLQRVNHYSIHGGSIILMLRHNDCDKPVHVSVESFLAGEDNIGLAAWNDFRQKAEFNINRLHGMVEELVLRQQKTVVGCGASAKSTVWINAAGIGKWIRFITDNTPQKIGKFSPGTTIPIVSEEKLIEVKPDAAILFAWNFRDEMLEKHSEWHQGGGKFIIPCPKLEIV